MDWCLANFRTKNFRPTAIFLPYMILFFPFPFELKIKFLLPLHFAANLLTSVTSFFSGASGCKINPSPVNVITFFSVSLGSLSVGLNLF